MTPNSAGTAGPLLSVEHLTVRFGATTVVDDVSFTIAPGEKFALVGESGSGKSITALSILKLVRDARTAGAIRFAGEELLALPEQRRQLVAAHASRPRAHRRYALMNGSRSPSITASTLPTSMPVR